jgi:rhamnosyltransferase
MQTINTDSKKTVCGVTVLYNPQKNVIYNINSYLEQIDYLYIIDNSEKFSDFIKSYYEASKKVEYISNKSNLGIAAALNIGAHKALEKGFQYLLTMDQDSKAPSFMVESLLNTALSNVDVGIVSPKHSNKFGTHINIPVTKDVVRVMTSGNLLFLEAYNVAGDYNEDYFIDYIDIDYCMRLHHLGFKVIQLEKVILEHNEANIVEKTLFKKKFYPTNNPPFRWYYKSRNLLYLRKQYRKIFPGQCREELNIFIRNVVKILLFEDKKVLKIKMILVGILDYLKRKKGRKFLD